LKKTN